MACKILKGEEFGFQDFQKNRFAKTRAAFQILS